MINGETACHLLPLASPSGPGPTGLSALGRFEAVRLFIDRANGVGRPFAVDE